MISTVLVYEPKGAPFKGAPLFQTTDPYRNLAREEVLLQEVKEGEILLYLWQNQNTVVIGKNQNCYKECRVALLEEEGGHLARRLSGGGAVFHDLGNLNYTFIAPKEEFDVSRQTKVILEAVRSFGIEAKATGRNDIAVESRKFSGNAYYRTKDTCYQHGTLLVEVDPEKIGRYLSVSRKKLESKGVDSVRSRVVGLKEFAPDLTIEAMKEALRGAMAKEYGPIAFENRHQETIEEKASLLREKYASPDWLYGENLTFTYRVEHRFDWGGVEVGLAVKEGQIQKAAVYTDDLSVHWPLVLSQGLEGALCRIEELKNVFSASSEQEKMLLRLSKEEQDKIWETMDFLIKSL